MNDLSRRMAATALLTLGCAPAMSAPPVDRLPALRAFMEEYAGELNAGNRDALWRRYDPRGAMVHFNGSARVQTQAEIRSTYLARWRPPRFFAWDSLSFHQEDATTAIVLGRFRWLAAEPDTLRFSYAAVMRYTPEGWRIRAEVETRLR